MNPASSTAVDSRLCQGQVKTDWQAQWVWPTAEPTARNAYAAFRRTFSTPVAGTLSLALTADSFYWLYLDGVWHGRGPTRAHLDYYSFDRYELAVTAGEHVLAVMVHHIGVVNATVMTGRPGLLVEAALSCPGQAPLALGTDQHWRACLATAWRQDLPCLMSHFGFWEERDLAAWDDAWTTPAFTDTPWSPPVVLGAPPLAPWRQLIEPDLPLPWRLRVAGQGVASGSFTPGSVSEDSEAKRKVVAGGWLPGAPTLEIPSKLVASRQRVRLGALALPWPLTLTRDPDRGAWLTWDFGRTISGYPRVQVECAADGVVVELAYDDFTTPLGAINPERSYARLADRFILPRGRHWLQPLQPRGFRFLGIDLHGQGAVTVLAVEALDETYPFAAPAPLAFSDPRLAAYARQAAETVRICSTDSFTDCATRERVQWMEDAYLHAKVAAYTFGDTRLLRRALFQGAQNALPDGRINGFMPSERTGCAFASSSLVWLHLLVDYWLYSGQQEDLERLLPTARRLLAFIRSRASADGLLTWPSGQFWEWAPIEGGGCLLLTNAAYAWALQRLAEQPMLAAALGPDLLTQAETIRRLAHERFWDAERQLYRDAVPAAGQTAIYSQSANSLAVLGGVCPPAARQALLRRLTDATQLHPVPVGEASIKPDKRPSSDRIVPVGTLWFGHFLCQALYEADMADEALEQMHRLWGACADLPTCPETRIQGGNTFLCHGWAAGPAYLLPAYVLGVRPTAPGWRAVTVQPRLGALSQASGSIPTPHGPIVISCTVRDGQRQVSVQAPPGIQVKQA